MGKPKRSGAVLANQPDPVVLDVITARGRTVVLDRDIASLYGVSTKQLNQQVKRNHNRFPPDFVFQLRLDEWRELRSNNAIWTRHGNRKYRPYAFTEQGAAMLAGLFQSPRAAQIRFESSAPSRSTALPKHPR